MKLKKALVFLAAVLTVPVYCAFMGELSSISSSAYKNLYTLFFYSVLTLVCVKYLWGKPVKSRDWALALLLGVITTAYTIPLHWIGLAAALCTLCVFLACRSILAEENSDFLWIRPGLKENAMLLGGITGFYLLIYFARYGGPIRFSGILALKAWAPAISEELIFRLFLPAVLYRILDLDDSFGDKAWVFCTVTVFFGLLHCMELLADNQISQVLSRCYTIAVNSLVSAVLIHKYGFFYGAYAHAMSDFLAMGLWMNQ